MKVYAFPADLGGCGYYRVIWPAEVLKRQGFNIEIIYPQQRNKALNGVMRGETMIDVKIPADADVIVLQRVTHRFLVQAIRLIRNQGVAVIVDFDDDLTCIHPANPAFAMLHPRGGIRDHSWENTLAAADVATMVTVSTPALVDRYGRRRPGHVLYNMVPKRMLDVPRNDSDIVGWAGSIHSHPTDLQAMGSAVAQHVQTGGKFKVVGPPIGVGSALGIQGELDSTGIIQDIAAWPLAVACLGVGLAPLADSKFNKSKSWLKMAEYAACGVPCIGSPRPEYARLHKKGIGLLARSGVEWRQKIKQLTTEPEYRSELSEKGRAVMADLTIEENAWRWWEAWSEALRMERESYPLGKPR